VATLYSAIAMPLEGRLSICTGNPGMPYWGTLAPGQTGIYVNYTLGQGPESLVFALQKDASSSLWQTVQALGVAEGAPPEEATALWEEAEGSCWEAAWWMDRAVLEDDPSARAAVWGRSATGYGEVIVRAAEVQEACKRARPTN